MAYIWLVRNKTPKGLSEVRHILTPLWVLAANPFCYVLFILYFFIIDN